MPILVGDAACPWVLANIEMFFHELACFSNSFINSVSSGYSTSSSAFFIENGTAVLLISWDVNPKWINSLNSESDNSSNFSLMKYSTALTSWFVIDSISLILIASSEEKLEYIFLSVSNFFEVKWFNCVIELLQSAMKYSISTWIRNLINDDSEKYCCSSCVFELYLPSIGLIASSGENFIFFLQNYVNKT